MRQAETTQSFGTAEKAAKSLDGAITIEAWGKTVEGRSGLTGSSTTKLLRDAFLTLKGDLVCLVNELGISG